MQIKFEGSVEVTHVSGKFTGRDEIRTIVEEAVQGALDDLNFEEVGADGESVYEATDTELAVE